VDEATSQPRAHITTPTQKIKKTKETLFEGLSLNGQSRSSPCFHGLSLILVMGTVDEPGEAAVGWTEHSQKSSWEGQYTIDFLLQYSRPLHNRDCVTSAYWYSLLYHQQQAPSIQVGVI
jgi:hypothetical protein